MPGGVPAGHAARMTTATPSSTRPTLRRSSTDRMLGGVCGGLAEYTGIDVVLWRVGFVALALMGAGILAYILLWIVMPGPEQPSGAPFESQVQRVHAAVYDALGNRNRP